MTIRDFQINFERRLQLMDPELTHSKKLNSDTIFSFINEAIDKFYKTRYSGINSKGEGFEQSQKRIDDLRTLVKTIEADTISMNKTRVSNDTYTIELPTDYAFMLGDTVGIRPINDSDPCWPKDNDGVDIIKYTDTIEASVETIDRQLENSLSEHLLKFSSAKPLKLIQGNEVKLFTDGKYMVDSYTITYLSKPTFIDKENITNTEYTSLPEHTHMEIVKMAVQLYLATRPMQHYSAYSAEVNNME